MDRKNGGTVPCHFRIAVFAARGREAEVLPAKLAMEALLRPEEAARLKSLGVRRAREFTWERTARATLEAYARAFGRA